MRIAAQEAKASANQQESKDNDSPAEESDHSGGKQGNSPFRRSPRTRGQRGRGGGKSGAERRGGGQERPAIPAALGGGRGRQRQRPLSTLYMCLTSATHSSPHTFADLSQIIVRAKD